MANLWNQEGVPHKGWQLEDVIDVREEGQPEWETEYETCMMCGQAKIRYVHIVSHPEYGEEFRVGCNCAANMTEDYINPSMREQELRKKSNRRLNWAKKEWRTNLKGNHYLRHQGHFLLIYKEKRTLKYKVKIDDTFGKKSFNDLSKAKIAVFNGIEYMKEKGKW